MHEEKEPKPRCKHNFQSVWHQCPFCAKEKEEASDKEKKRKLELRKKSKGGKNNGKR